jgi:hypothetical protein
MVGAGSIRIDGRHFRFPARAVELIRRSGVSGNLALTFDWGEYALWYLGPCVKVSMDGRRETVYTDEVYRQSLDFERGTGAWDALLQPGTTDMVLVASGSATANLMDRAPGWLPVHRDVQAALYARAGSPLVGPLRDEPSPEEVAPDGHDRTFPGPPRERTR